MKPKLVKIPKESINHTEEGMLIKVNDKLFVLVESEKVNASHKGQKIWVRDWESQNWQLRILEEYRTTVIIGGVKP